MISSCIILLGLFILKIEHALTIALLIGFVDVLPLIGTGLVFIPWIGYLFITNDYFLTIGLSLIYMVVVISRQFIEPKILSAHIDRKSTRLNSSHVAISYAVFCLKKKKKT